MELFEALHTQRAIRRFKSDPVSEKLIRRVLDAAIRAPSGGNSQPWYFLVLRDAEIRAKVAGYYRRAWEESGLGRLTEDSDRSRARIYRNASYLADHMAEVPVIILACIRRGPSEANLTTGASIYPAVQNLMVAARGLGLGTVLTTIHRRYEAKIKAMLEIPEDVATAALIPMGYPEGTGFGPTDRKPVEEVAYLDRWDAALRVGT